MEQLFNVRTRTFRNSTSTFRSSSDSKIQYYDAAFGAGQENASHIKYKKNKISMLSLTAIIKLYNEIF